MPLMIERNDITRMRVDAIVNAANSSLLGGGGVDGCIHRAAGPALLEECRTLGGCPTGSARVTGAGNLPCTYVIHAVGPIWQGGMAGERELLASCYRTSLELAWERNCRTVAFPLISAGAYGYPKDQALRVAVDSIGAFLADHDLTVYLVIFDQRSYQIGTRLFAEIRAYVDDHYVESVEEPGQVQMRRQAALLQSAPGGLTDALNRLDQSFSQKLLGEIDRRGMTDVQCYKKANLDRKLFSKIRSDPDYRPSKPTVLAFAVALELNLAETKALLEAAGFALSHARKFDVIVEYFISKGNYNIYEINEALFAFDQCLLGG